MQKLAVLVVLAALAAVGTSVFLLRQTPPRDLLLIRPDPPTHPIPRRPVPPEESGPTRANVDVVSPTSRPAWAVVDDDLMAVFEQFVGAEYAVYLQERGLSGADSERVVAAMFSEGIECSLAMMRLEAESRGITLDVLRDTLIAWQRDPKAAPPDVAEALQARGMACRVSAAQQAGIPLSVLDEIYERAGAKLRAAAQ